MLLSQAMDEFGVWASSTYAASTVRTYTDLVNRFFKFVGDMELDEINITHVTSYHMHLKKKGYADSSMAFMMISIRQLFRFLFLRRIVLWDYNLISVPRYVSRSYRPIEKEEVNALIERVRGEGMIALRNRVIFALLYSSGVRVSELCDLRVAEMKLDERYAVIISKKNRKTRMIFWDKRTATLLEQYLPMRRMYAKSEYLIISADRDPMAMGKRMTTRSVQRFFQCHRDLDSDASPHTCRHGLGMRTVKANIHTRYTQTILGHKNANSSQIYQDLYDVDVVEAYKKVEAIS